jgi:hypothetical protein
MKTTSAPLELFVEFVPVFVDKGCGVCDRLLCLIAREEYFVLNLGELRILR